MPVCPDQIRQPVANGIAMAGRVIRQAAARPTGGTPSRSAPTKWPVSASWTKVHHASPDRRGPGVWDVRSGWKSVFLALRASW
ncbi:hypothetical protein LV478_13750 [Komagataeibacter oboediens]|uniref:hypothetical protein n=1 Tax=Komagataeibacter oboediens TaxID=65958 RepID=UPI0023DB250B|nr:hypothetical protein [Komagataeibacter oboediens]WEQ51573.1 hypothetical protein LV478_13750 [Komagataeibacter oboediens]